MFTLKLYDRKGKEIHLGDIVKISDGKHFNFWARVTFLDKEKVIAPFHTFSFHSFEKVKEVPANAIKSSDDRYDIWYVYHDDAEEDKEADNHAKYLSGWRECESLINDRCWRIECSTDRTVVKGFTN